MEWLTTSTSRQLLYADSLCLIPRHYRGQANLVESREEGEGSEDYRHDNELPLVKQLENGGLLVQDTGQHKLHLGKRPTEPIVKAAQGIRTFFIVFFLSSGWGFWAAVGWEGGTLRLLRASAVSAPEATASLADMMVAASYSRSKHQVNHGMKARLEKERG